MYKTGGFPEMVAKLKASRIWLVTLSLFFLALLVWPRGGATHEPITTKVRFNKEVIRVFQRSCLGCHKPGGIAPMSLATYEEARPWAKAIKEEMLEKRMPPWHAVRGYGEFRNAPMLTQREVDLIVNWVEGGAPKGQDKDLPADPLFSDDWSLGKPDLILKPQREHQVASDADEYQSFVLPAKLKEDRWITAIDLKPGKGSVVHCATVYVEKDENGGVKNEKRKPARPASSSFTLHPSSSIFSTWLPGQTAVAFADGVARLLPANSRLVLKIHYRGAGEAVKDLSEVGLYFAKAAPRKQASEISISNPDAVIPAGVHLYQLKASFTLQDDAEAIAIRPRAHPLVVSLQATAYRPDGTEEVMIWTRGYRFDWQTTYYFKHPIALAKGTRVEVIAYLDNSEKNSYNPDSPPRQVRWSDLTRDPLCALTVATARADAEAVSRR